MIRTVFYKYFHPKEALISNGVLNRSLAHAAGKVIKGSLDDDENNAQYVTFAYNVYDFLYEYVHNFGFSKKFECFLILF